MLQSDVINDGCHALALIYDGGYNDALQTSAVGWHRVLCQWGCNVCCCLADAQGHGKVEHLSQGHGMRGQARLSVVRGLTAGELDFGVVGSSQYLTSCCPV